MAKQAAGHMQAALPLLLLLGLLYGADAAGQEGGVAPGTAAAAAAAGAGGQLPARLGPGLQRGAAAGVPARQGRGTTSARSSRLGLRRAGKGGAKALGGSEAGGKGAAVADQTTLENGAESLLEPITTQAQRLRSTTHLGDAVRLRKLLLRLQSGKAINIAVLGGSISAGVGIGGWWNGWNGMFLNWLRHRYPGAHKLANLAHPGSTSSFASACVSDLVPEETDLIFIEYAVNDGKVGRGINTPERMGFERLLRKMLNHPNRPAVVLLNFMIPGSPTFIKNPYTRTADAEFGEFATYYGVPVVSLKPALWHDMISETSGFKTRELWGESPVHPSVRGHQAAAEFLASMFERLGSEMQAQAQGPKSGLGRLGLSAGELDEIAQRPLPEPLNPDNYEAKHSICYTKTTLKAHVIVADGWEYMDETRNLKWGYVSTAPGAVLNMSIDVLGQQGASAAAAPVPCEVTYLTSYTGYGQAQVRCQGGCKCDPVTIDAHSNERASVTKNEELMVTPGKNCVISIRLLKQTSSTAHKFKVFGFTVGTRGMPPGPGAATPSSS